MNKEPKTQWICGKCSYKSTELKCPKCGHMPDIVMSGGNGASQPKSQGKDYCNKHNLNHGMKYKSCTAKTQGKIEEKIQQLRDYLVQLTIVRFDSKIANEVYENEYNDFPAQILNIFNQEIQAQQNDLIERVIELIGELRPAMGTAEIKSGYYNSALDDVLVKISQMGEGLK